MSRKSWSARPGYHAKSCPELWLPRSGPPGIPVSCSTSEPRTSGRGAVTSRPEGPLLRDGIDQGASRRLSGAWAWAGGTTEWIARGRRLLRSASPSPGRAGRHDRGLPADAVPRRHRAWSGAAGARVRLALGIFTHHQLVDRWRRTQAILCADARCRRLLRSTLATVGNRGKGLQPGGRPLGIVAARCGCGYFLDGRVGAWEVRFGADSR